MATIKERIQRIANNLGETYEPFVRIHLAQLYLLLGATAGTTALGVVFYLNDILNLGTTSAVASLRLVMGLYFSKGNGKNFCARLAMLLTFGFCSGQTLSPLLEHIISINPDIIVTALLGTMATFLSLSLAAIFAERGKYLYLGGFLVTMINTMAILSVFNLFFEFYFVQMVQLYVGVFIMTAFVIFDTQNIIEKCRAGNRDAIYHALNLYFEVLSIFRRLLIILAQKE